jgi:cytidylate kinase
LAKKLDILFLSTGATYRAFGLYCKNLGLDADNASHAEISSNAVVEIKYENGSQQTYLNNENVTNLINNEVVGSYASKISKHLIIREKCVDIQRKIASKQSMVVDGRDIGSVVLPNAKFKFYLDADVNVRAKRRLLDLQSSNPNLTYEEVLNDLKQRDFNDTTRKLSPLVLCEDAIKINSTNLSIEEVIEKFLEIINS